MKKIFLFLVLFAQCFSESFAESGFSEKEITAEQKSIIAQDCMVDIMRNDISKIDEKIHQALNHLMLDESADQLLSEIISLWERRFRYAIITAHPQHETLCSLIDQAFKEVQIEQDCQKKTKKLLEAAAKLRTVLSNGTKKALSGDSVSLSERYKVLSDAAESEKKAIKKLEQQIAVVDKKIKNPELLIQEAKKQDEQVLGPVANLDMNAAIVLPIWGLLNKLRAAITDTINLSSHWDTIVMPDDAEVVKFNDALLQENRLSDVRNALESEKMYLKEQLKNHKIYLREVQEKASALGIKRQKILKKEEVEYLFLDKTFIAEFKKSQRAIAEGVECPLNVFKRFDPVGCGLTLAAPLTYASGGIGLTDLAVLGGALFKNDIFGLLKDTIRVDIQHYFVQLLEKFKNITIDDVVNLDLIPTIEQSTPGWGSSFYESTLAFLGLTETLQENIKNSGKKIIDSYERAKIVLGEKGANSYDVIVEAFSGSLTQKDYMIVLQRCAQEEFEYIDSWLFPQEESGCYMSDIQDVPDDFLNNFIELENNPDDYEREVARSVEAEISEQLSSTLTDFRDRYNREASAIKKRLSFIAEQYAQQHKSGIETAHKKTLSQIAGKYRHSLPVVLAQRLESWCRLGRPSDGGDFVAAKQEYKNVEAVWSPSVSTYKMLEDNTRYYWNMLTSPLPGCTIFSWPLWPLKLCGWLALKAYAPLPLVYNGGQLALHYKTYREADQNITSAQKRYEQACKIHYVAKASGRLAKKIQEL